MILDRLVLDKVDHVNKSSNNISKERLYFTQVNSDSMGDPTLISLYSGCGGSALGFRDAGFKIIFMNDINEDACKSLRINFKNGNEKVVHEGDIRKKEVAEKIRMLKENCDTTVNLLKCCVKNNVKKIIFTRY